MPSDPAISIVVTARNEAASIATCLRSLADQREIGGSEIILVDDRSTDDTGAVAAALGLENLRIIRLDHHDHPALTARQVALDVAFKSARGEFIFLTDADGVAPPDWVRRQLEVFSNKSVDAVAGRVDFLPNTEGTNRWIARLQTVDGAFYTGICALLNACGLTSGFVFGNCAFRRECYQRTGGFDAIGFALTEDLAFARALRAAGCRLGFSAQPAIAVMACGSWSELIRRAQRVGAGGFSALSLLLGIWMLLWIGLGFSALIAPGWFAVPFIIRHLLGAGFVAWWLARGGRFQLLPLALLYEPAAIVVGIAVLWSGRSKRKVEWGGVDYTP